MTESTAVLAINAAKEVIDKKITAQEVSDKSGVSRAAITMARIILEYGSAQDMLNLTSGSIGLKSLADTVKARLTPEQRLIIKKRQGAHSEKHRENMKSDAEMWAKLQPILNNFSSFPKPEDVLRIVRAHRKRRETVAQHIESAANWMEAFYNGWLSTRTKPDNSDTHTGNGDGAPGTQYPKSAA